MNNIKILIADSSPVYKKMFLKAIDEVDENVFVTCVANGKDAVDNIVRKSPGIVIVDAEIQGVPLSEILKFVTHDAPKTFVLVTARPSSTSAKIFMEALAAGASDSMTKPIYDSYEENLETIKIKLSEIIEIQRASLETGDSVKRAVERSPASNAKEKKTPSAKSFRPQIVLIAVSTGGPRALETIIPALRPDIPVPILVVQHMPPHFIETLAERLDSKSKLKVRVAVNGEKIAGKTVYLAPGGIHMRLSADSEVYFDDSPPINGVRPAADALFESIAEDFSGLRILTIVLTGMGQDSVRGLVKLKDKKMCYCLAQSEKTCVVYGMPRAVIEEGLADKVLDLENIAPEINGFNYI